jgi:hypothetical protein
MVNQRAHGQSRGSCNLHLRAERVSRPGSPSSVLRMVLATTSSSRVPSHSAGDPAQQVMGQGGGQQATGMSAACITVARLVAITWPLVAARLKRSLPVEAILRTDLAAVSVVPVGGPRCRPV